MRIAHNFDRNYEHTITKSSNSLLYFSSRMCPDMFICICVILLNVDALAPPPLKVLLYVFRILLNVSSHCLSWMPSSKLGTLFLRSFEAQVGSAGALRALLCGFTGESWSGVPNLRNDGCTVNGPPPGDSTSCLLHGRKLIVRSSLRLTCCAVMAGLPSKPLYPLQWLSHPLQAFPRRHVPAL